MPRGCHSLRLYAVVLSALVLSGCAGSGASRFYLLQPLTSAGSSHPSTAGAHTPVVGVGPVSVPEYLDRPQIVTRTTGNELRLAEYHRWAEPLEDNFASVVAENLSVLLPTDYVTVLPWSGSARLKYQVTVKLIQFDGSTAGRVRLRADWSILDGSSGKVLAMRKSNISLAADAKDYETLVAAESKAVAELSRQIAGAVKALQAQDRVPGQ